MNTFSVDVYDKNMAYLGRIDPNKLRSGVKFSEDANGGQRGMKIRVAQTWDEPHDLYKPFNFIRVIQINNTHTPLGRLVYSGWVYKVQRNSQTGVTLHVYGLVSLLKRVFFKSGGSLDVSYTSADPSTMVANIIASWQSEYPSTGDLWIGTNAVTENGQVIRVGSQVVATGNSVDFDFKKKNCFDAIKKCIELTGSGWYWKIDHGGDVLFKEKPSTATHTFTIGKDIQEVDAPVSIEDVKNSVYIDYSGGTATGSDSTSIDSFGKAEYHAEEETNLAGATEIVNQKLDELKDEKYLAKIVLNNEYDIFSVKAGDSCEVLNVHKDNDIFNDNMFIKNVEYSENSAIITLEEQELDIASVIKDLG